MRALQMPKLLDQSERLQALRAKAAFHGRQHSFDQAMRKLLKSTDGRIADSIVADLLPIGETHSRPMSRFTCAVAWRRLLRQMVRFCNAGPVS